MTSDSTNVRTIIVVTYERLLATQRCIEAVLAHTPRPFRLIVCDNSSNSEMQRYIGSLTGVRVLLDRNVGLYVALNHCFRFAESELVGFLDADVVVSPGWWDALEREINADPTVGLAGARFLNDDGSLQEGFPVLRPDGYYGANSEDRQVPSDCQYIAIGCSVMRRSAWITVGGFDEEYFISHGDIDYCYKLRYEGRYRIRYCPSCSVVHDRNFGRELHYEALRFDARVVGSDHARFMAKWGPRLADEQLSDRFNTV